MQRRQSSLRNGDVVGFGLKTAGVMVLKLQPMEGLEAHRQH